MGDTATQLELTQLMADFKDIFPDMEVDVIEAVLRSNNGAVDTTIDQLLAMSADNEPGLWRGEQRRAGDLPPAYGEAMQNQGGHGRAFGDQGDCGPLGPASNLGPDLLSSLGASGGSMGAPLHTQKGWRPPMLGRLPPDFLRIGSRSGNSRGTSERQADLGQGHAYNHPDRHRAPPSESLRDTSGQISEDERFAQMLQNEEFMTELRGNTEFLSALEEENSREEEAVPAPR